MLTFSTCKTQQSTCYSNFSLYMDNSTTVNFTGQGSKTNPLKAHVNVSKDAGNLLTIRQDGLYASNQIQFLLSILDSSSIDFSGDGKPATPLTGVVKISANPTNVLMLNDDGLYVPPGGGPAPSGGCVNSVTYEELILLIDGDGTEENPGGMLQPGCLYLITDYRTTGDIMRLAFNGNSISVSNTEETYEGDIDPILIRAINEFDLEPWGITVESGDEVRYNVFSGDYGRITRRIDKNRRIDIGLDWKAVQVMYDNTLAGGTIQDEVMSTFRFGYSESYDIFIGIGEYNIPPYVLIGGSGSCNIHASQGSFFIIGSSSNISLSDFHFLDITKNRSGFNTLEESYNPVITLSPDTTDFTLSGSQFANVVRRDSTRITYSFRLAVERTAVNPNPILKFKTTNPSMFVQNSVSTLAVVDSNVVGQIRLGAWVYSQFDGVSAFEYVIQDGPNFILEDTVLGEILIFTGTLTFIGSFAE